MLDPSAGSCQRAFALLSDLIPDTFPPNDPVPHRTILFGIYMGEITGRAASTRAE